MCELYEFARPVFLVQNRENAAGKAVMDVQHDRMMAFFWRKTCHGFSVERRPIGYNVDFTPEALASDVQLVLQRMQNEAHLLGENVCMVKKKGSKLKFRFTREAKFMLCEAKKICNGYEKITYSWTTT